MSQTEAKGSKQEEEQEEKTRRKKEGRLEGSAWSLQGVERGKRGLGRGGAGERLKQERGGGGCVAGGVNMTRTLNPL